MAKIALMDNDFIQKLAEIKKPQEEKERIINQVFDAIGIQGKMHELLHKHEFCDINNSGLFFEHGIISILDLNIVFGNNEEKKIYYYMLVPELYKKMSGEELGIKDVIKEWKKGCSLGEVHSLATCMVYDCGMFLSDDHGSKNLKRIIERDYSQTISVYNREELINKLTPGILRKSDRNAFKHAR